MIQLDWVSQDRLSAVPRGSPAEISYNERLIATKHCALRPSDAAGPFKAGDDCVEAIVQLRQRVAHCQELNADWR